ncbi:Similar to DNA-directed RNA polymerase II subunit RPB1; acc. no. P35074 [Pyronema omphalodes CBS 100304]|uniref:Similar to DNA-directed RNA polymerase II subunit RPB1 acc. no. P35074 n=1 Tax=Pyronema omphalodes (strain CBS 100304) TaxID=1076935 RepID=U4L5N9_PYROM|nr:Similar to DNA-directed RNA polymerase II subunit RPB1; acc. no. P35074 [Pyronema omphalodes CBS 100304]
MDTLLNDWEPGSFMQPNRGATSGDGIRGNGNGDRNPNRGLTAADFELVPVKPSPSPKPSLRPNRINTSVTPAPTPSPVNDAGFSATAVPDQSPGKSPGLDPGFSATAVPNLNPGSEEGRNPFIQYHAVPSKTPNTQDKTFLVSNGTAGPPILAHRRKDKTRGNELTTNKYYKISINVAKRIEMVPLSLNLPVDKLWRSAPNLTIRQSDANFGSAEGRKLGELYGSEFTAELLNRAMSTVFTNCSSRLINPSTGELIIELCLDTLQPFENSRKDPSKITTPCGKRYIELEAPNVGYSYQVGFVKRLCISLRQNYRGKAWNFTILTHDGVDYPSWEEFERRLHSGSLWTVHAIMDPRRILVDFIRTQMMWNDFTQDLRSTIAELNSRAISRMDMPKAVDMLYRELHVLNDCELALASNMNVISTLRDTLYFSESELKQLGLPPNGNHVAMEIKNIYTELSHNMLFLQQLKQEVSTTIDMVFNTVQVDHGVLALKQGDLVYHQSESMKRLTYLTVFFLPATFVATIFGMNGPSTADPPLWLFFVVVVPISVVCFMVLYGLEYLTTFRNKLLDVFRFPWRKLPAQGKMASDMMEVNEMTESVSIPPSPTIFSQNPAIRMPQKAPDSPEYRPSSPQDTPHSPGYTPASPKVDFSSPSSAVLPSDPTWTSRRNQKSPDSAQKLPYLPPELLSEISNYTRHRPSPSKDQKVDDGELPGQPSKPFILQQQQQRQQQQYQLQQQQPIQQQQKQQQLIEQQRIQQQIQQLIERQRILQQQQQQNAFRPDEVTLPKDFNPGLTEPYRGVFGAPERLPGSYGSTDDQPSSPTASDISRRLGLVRQIRGGELPSSVAYIPPGAELFEPNTGNTNISQGPDFLFQKLRSTDGRSAEQIRAARRGARRHQALGNRPPSVTPQVGEGIVGADMAGEEAGSRSRSRVRNDSQTIPETTEAPIPGEPQADSSSAPPRQSSYTPPPAHHIQQKTDMSQILPEASTAM